MLHPDGNEQIFFLGSWNHGNDDSGGRSKIKDLGEELSYSHALHLLWQLGQLAFELRPVFHFYGYQSAQQASHGGTNILTRTF